MTKIQQIQFLKSPKLCAPSWYPQQPFPARTLHNNCKGIDNHKSGNLLPEHLTFLIILFLLAFIISILKKRTFPPQYYAATSDPGSTPHSHSAASTTMDLPRMSGFTSLCVSVWMRVFQRSASRVSSSVALPCVYWGGIYSWTQSSQLQLVWGTVFFHACSEHPSTLPSRCCDYRQASMLVHLNTGLFSTPSQTIQIQNLQAGVLCLVPAVLLSWSQMSNTFFKKQLKWICLPLPRRPGDI